MCCMSLDTRSYSGKMSGSLHQFMWKPGHAIQLSWKCLLSSSGVDQRADGHDSSLLTSVVAFRVAPSPVECMPYVIKTLTRIWYGTGNFNLAS